ncbi:hypothetical protein NA56DRAFT_716009 [Hyaloscypha hepaticicola]|uniref:Uncharacterized protein n=1 Tax=Hyaloscypha hepaticicola TaxID=2082293 RepID=A0A2J6QBE5_9HELO|nr:hypothetical protein NA56DRAFT_716009 [Hyaloscypha hepaticicola]
MLGQWEQEEKHGCRLKIPGFLSTPKSSNTSRAASILKSTNKPKPKSTDTQPTLRRPQRPISITTQIATPSQAAFNLTSSVSASDALPIVELADEEPTTLKKWSMKSMTESPPWDRSTKRKVCRNTPTALSRSYRSEHWKTKESLSSQRGFPVVR